MIENVYTVHSDVWRVPCRVVRVIDAATIRVDADLGWGISKTNLDVHIDKLWCPKRSTAKGQSAFEWAKAELPVGTPLTLHSRWMIDLSSVVGIMYLSDGRSYPDVCVSAGHGQYR